MSYMGGQLGLGPALVAIRIMMAIRLIQEYIAEYVWPIYRPGELVGFSIQDNAEKLVCNLFHTVHDRFSGLLLEAEDFVEDCWWQSCSWILILRDHRRRSWSRPTLDWSIRCSRTYDQHAHHRPRVSRASISLHPHEFSIRQSSGGRGEERGR